MNVCQTGGGAVIICVVNYYRESKIISDCGWMSLSYTQIFRLLKTIYLKMIRPIFSHLVVMREGVTGIFPDNKFRGVVQISLGRWTKTYTVSVVT